MTAQDIAILIGATTTGITVIGSFVLQVMSFRAGRQRDAKLAQVHDLVNGQSEAIKKAIGESSFAEGHAAGVLEERDDPHVGVRK